MCGVFVSTDKSALYDPDAWASTAPGTSPPAHTAAATSLPFVYLLTLISPFAVKALALTKHGKTPFPAQVPVKLLMDLGNMPEEEFLEILEYSAYCQCPHLFYLPLLLLLLSSNTGMPLFHCFSTAL